MRKFLFTVLALVPNLVLANSSVGTLKSVNVAGREAVGEGSTSVSYVGISNSGEVVGILRQYSDNSVSEAPVTMDPSSLSPSDAALLEGLYQSYRSGGEWIDLK